MPFGVGDGVTDKLPQPKDQPVAVYALPNKRSARTCCLSPCRSCRQSRPRRDCHRSNQTQEHPDTVADRHTEAVSGADLDRLARPGARRARWPAADRLEAHHRPAGYSRRGRCLLLVGLRDMLLRFEGRDGAARLARGDPTLICTSSTTC